MGWCIEPGIGFKSVYKVVPLDSVRAFLEGKSELKVATTTKIVEVKPLIFSFKELARQKFAINRFRARAR